MDDQIFKALVEEFYLESVERVTQIETDLLEVESADEESHRAILVAAKRELHTLKGNSGMMGLSELQGLAHELEDRVVELERGDDVSAILAGLDGFRRLLAQSCGREEATHDEPTMTEGDDAIGVQESVRVGFTALDKLVELLSEMVIFRNRLSETLDVGLQDLGKRARLSSTWSEVEVSHEMLSRTLDELQTRIMRLRMVPLGSLFAQLKRIVHDESGREGKEVEFVASGGETPLDKSLLEVASEAMGHVVRNAVIHGIERPEDRERAGKPERGSLKISASTDANEVTIEIVDDGGGVNRSRLIEKARSQGFEVTEETELQTLLSLPGVSVRDIADESSGRGMGMSAVVESVRRRGGQVELATEEGVGTAFRLRFPLTAAIIRALLVVCDGQTYAVPLNVVQESMSLSDFRRHSMNQAGVVRWRKSLVTLLDLGLAFSTATEPRDDGYVVLIEAEGRYRGLVVDAMAGIRDVVVKSLDEVAGGPAGVGGCTILGDGRVVLILDPTGLVYLSPFKEQAV